MIASLPHVMTKVNQFYGILATIASLSTIAKVIQRHYTPSNSPLLIVISSQLRAVNR